MLKMTTARHFTVFLLFAFWCVQFSNSLALSKKSLASNDGATSVEKEDCQGRTPCGWAVYNRTNRYIDYFMRNKCECSKDKKCLRDDDDISITAYVYRCKIDNKDSS